MNTSNKRDEKIAIDRHNSQWVGLTHEEVNSWELPDFPTVFEFAQFIEAKLKEKNDNQWVGLTHEEKHYLNDILNLQGRFPIIDAIESKLKYKNQQTNGVSNAIL